MKIEVRSDHVLISGYVNAVGRDSRPLPSPTGKFVEMVEPGVFRAALERAQDVQLLLNHDKNHVLGSVAQGNLKLCEDNIGLRAECTVTDSDVIEKARKGELRGWSFGMYVNNADMEERADNIPRRHLKDIDIFEVSLIDKSKLPCYAGTSVECRADSEVMAETRSVDDVAEIKCLVPPDLSDYERRLNDIYLRAYERRLAELRYNPYHDPTNGRFTSGSGGGGYLFVGKGKKGKGQYVFNQNKGEDFDDDEYKKWAASKSGAKRELDKKQISHANAQGSIFYDSGSEIARTYDKEYDEIGKLNIPDEEKAAARDKIYEYSAAELQARQKYYDVYKVGPARKVSGSDKAFDKAHDISSKHQAYMQSLREKSQKNTAAQKEAAFTSAFDVEAKKANASGAREITVNGETWFRTTKTSSTWTKGSLSEYQAKQKFMKSQKDVFIGNRKAWSDLSDEEKAKYYPKASSSRAFDPDDESG